MAEEGSAEPAAIEDEVREPWSIEKVQRETETWLARFKMPLMKRPEGLEREYTFPTDPRTLSSQQLGQIQLQLTAWLTYLLGVIGKEEADLGAFEEVLEVRLGYAMGDEKTRHTGVTPKEILRARCIRDQADLNRLHKTVIGRQHRLRRIKAQGEVYKEQVVRLSREQSRRESEASIVR